MTETQLALLSAILGITLPPLIDLINRWVPSAKARFIASVLICLIAGIVMNASRLMFGNLDQLLETILIVFTSAQGAYHLYYKDSKLQGTLRDTAKPETVSLDSDL